MTKAEEKVLNILLEKLETLEARLDGLEAETPESPKQEVHHHYHYHNTYNYPKPNYSPGYPWTVWNGVVGSGTPNTVVGGSSKNYTLNASSAPNHDHGSSFLSVSGGHSHGALAIGE